MVEPQDSKRFAVALRTLAQGMERGDQEVRVAVETTGNFTVMVITLREQALSAVARLVQRQTDNLRTVRQFAPGLAAPLGLNGEATFWFVVCRRQHRRPLNRLVTDVQPDDMHYGVWCNPTRTGGELVAFRLRYLGAPR